MVGAQVKAVKVTPVLLVARVEVAKVAQLIGLSCKCGTNYTLCSGLARGGWNQIKKVLKIRLCQILARARVETVKMAWGRYSPPTAKNAVCVSTTQTGEYGSFDKISHVQASSGSACTYVVTTKTSIIVYLIIYIVQYEMVFFLRLCLNVYDSPTS